MRKAQEMHYLSPLSRHWQRQFMILKGDLVKNLILIFFIVFFYRDIAMFDGSYGYYPLLNHPLSLAMS